MIETLSELELNMEKTIDDLNDQTGSFNCSENSCDGEDFGKTGEQLSMGNDGDPEHGSGSEVDVTDTFCNISQVYNSVDGVYTCEQCGEEFEVESRLKAHLMLHREDKVFRCHFCEKLFSKSSNLTSHLRIHTGEKPYRCKICLKTFAWMNGLRTHLPSIHRVEKELVESFIEKLDSPEAGNFDLTNSVEMEINGDIPVTEDEQKNSEVTDTSQGDSKISIDDNAETTYKFDIVETENYLIKTPVTKMSSKSNDDSIFHLDKKNTTYVCKYCSKEVSHKSNMNDHVRSHFGVKRFKCKLCGKALSRKQNLVHHLKYIHFIDNSRISSMIVLNDMVLSPSESNDKMKEKQHSIVSEEMLVDNGIVKEEPIDEYEYKSDDLGYEETKNRNELNILQTNTSAYIQNVKTESHTNEGLQGEENGMQVANKDINNVMKNNVLIVDTDGEESHYEVIEGETPAEKKYLCKICGFTCDRRYYMTTQHIMKHTGEKRYSCVICCKTYTRRFVFRKHVKKEHNIKEEDLEPILSASEISNRKLQVTECNSSTGAAQKNEGYNIQSKLTENSFEADLMEVQLDEHPSENTEKTEEKFQQLGDPESGTESISNSVSATDTSFEATINDGREETNGKETIAEEEFSFTSVPGDGPNKYIYKCNLCEFVCTRKYYMENVHFFKHSTSGKPYYMCVVCSKFYSRRYVLKNHLMKEHAIKGEELEEVLQTTGNKVESIKVLPKAVTNTANIEVDLSYGRESYFKSKKRELSTVSLESAVETLKRRRVMPSRRGTSSIDIEPEKERVEPLLECKGKNQNLLKAEKKCVTTDNEDSKFDHIDDLEMKDFKSDQVNAQNKSSVENKSDSSADEGEGIEDKIISEHDIANSLDDDTNELQRLKSTSIGISNNVNAVKLSHRKRAKKADHPFDHVMKPFMDMKTLTCLKCNKKCSKKSNLKQHIRILHFNLKEYMCQECNKTFNTKYNLKVHMKQHLNQEDRDSMNYDCYVCGKGFTTKSYLKVHLSRYHSVQYENSVQNESLGFENVDDSLSQ